MKSNDDVKVIHWNFYNELPAIELNKFNRKVSIEHFNATNRFPEKMEIEDNVYRDFLIEKFNQTNRNYFNTLLSDDELYESVYNTNSDASIYYVGNLSIHQNILSALFLLTDKDENDTDFLLLYNFCKHEIRSVIVLANQFNSFRNSGNESYYFKDYFIQLSNFARTEIDLASNYFPGSFLRKTNIRDRQCTFEYFSRFIINEQGHFRFIDTGY